MVWERKTNKKITEVKTINYFGHKIEVGDYRGYPVQKIGDRWRLRHILSACEKYKLKEIPKGFHVHHIDGNPKNFKKDNLIIIHKEDHKLIHKLLKELKR